MGCVLVLLHDGSDYKGTYISTLSLILGSGHFKLGHRGGKHFLGVMSGLREGRRLSDQALRHGWAQEWVRWLSVQESSCLEVCLRSGREVERSPGPDTQTWVDHLKEIDSLQEEKPGMEATHRLINSKRGDGRPKQKRMEMQCLEKIGYSNCQISNLADRLIEKPGMDFTTPWGKNPGSSSNEKTWNGSRRITDWTSKNQD